MHPFPSIAPFAPQLARLTADLCRGSCCLVSADKGWTHLLYRDIRDRLRAAEIHYEYIDGRPGKGDSRADDIGVMLTAINQLRRAIRPPVERTVVILAHLDVMTSTDGGWTAVSREMVPLLYESPEAVFLGFCDPTIPILPVVEKLFPCRYTLDQPYATALAVPPATAEPVPTGHSGKDDTPS